MTPAPRQPVQALLRGVGHCSTWAPRPTPLIEYDISKSATDPLKHPCTGQGILLRPLHAVHVQSSKTFGPCDSWPLAVGMGKVSLYSFMSTTDLLTRSSMAGQSSVLPASPVARSGSVPFRKGIAAAMGMPAPSLPAPRWSFVRSSPAKWTAITRPVLSQTGPPLLPGLVDASYIIISRLTSSSKPKTEPRTALTDAPSISPKGNPRTRISEDRLGVWALSVTAGISGASHLKSARSRSSATETTVASNSFASAPG